MFSLQFFSVFVSWFLHFLHFVFKVYDNLYYHYSEFFFRCLPIFSSFIWTLFLVCSFICVVFLCLSLFLKFCVWGLLFPGFMVEFFLPFGFCPPKVGSACTSMSEGVFLMYLLRERYSTCNYSSAILFPILRCSWFTYYWSLVLKDFEHYLASL